MSVIGQKSLGHVGAVRYIGLTRNVGRPIVCCRRRPSGVCLSTIGHTFHSVHRFRKRPRNVCNNSRTLRNGGPARNSRLYSTIRLVCSLRGVMRVAKSVSFTSRLREVTFGTLPARVSSSFVAGRCFRRTGRIVMSHRHHGFSRSRKKASGYFKLLAKCPYYTSGVRRN